MAEWGCGQLDDTKYRGINTLLLDPGEYITHKALLTAGGWLKKGVKRHMVVFWNWKEVKDEETG